MPTQPRMSLQTVAFNPTPFQAVTFTPQAADTSILAHSFDTIAQREKETSEKLGAMDATFSQLRTKLHQDPETLKWFEDFTRNQKAKVKNYVDNFDFAGAINKATELAGEVVNNPELNARINANTTYENQLNVVKKMRDDKTINPDIYNWWVDTHKYKFEPTSFDEQGNIISGTSYSEEYDMPFQEINYAQIAAAAQKLIEPKKSSTSTGSRSTKGTTGGDYGETTKTTMRGSTRSSSVETISMQDIRDNIEELINATSGGYAQVEQDYNVRVHSYKKLVDKLNNLRETNPESSDIATLEQQINERKKLLYKNGSPISYEEFYARMINENLFAKGLSKHWTTTSTTTESSDMSHRNASQHGTYTKQSANRFDGSHYNPTTQMWEMDNVRFSSAADLDAAEQAGYTISNILGF